MKKFFAQKKLLAILKTRQLSPSIKYEIKQLIRNARMDRQTIIDTVYQAIEFWDELREYENSTALEKYFLSNIKFEESSVPVPQKEEELESGSDESFEPDTHSFPDDVQRVNLVTEAADENETFFDDDVYYSGLFKKTDVRRFKDYLVLGEDEYDNKRNKVLFRVCFLFSLPISVAAVFIIDVILQLFSVHLNQLYYIPVIALVAIGLAFIEYIILEPRDLTWTYDRVITYMYTLSVVYLCIILCGGVVAYTFWRGGQNNTEKKFYFRTDNFEEYVKLHPEQPEGHMKLAFAYMSNDEHKKALDEINVALTLDPNIDEAVDLERAIVGIYIINKESVIHFSNGMLYKFINQDASALAEFQESVKLYQGFGAAHFYLGVIYFSRRDYQKAWEHATRARDLEYERAKELIFELQKYFQLPPM
ncbi:hypothetical protein KDK77_04845 [bacterium]|nr:hypothetical protein [bacterium]MCP5462520.1 hypothetical protein [bacterium]